MKRAIFGTVLGMTLLVGAAIAQPANPNATPLPVVGPHLHESNSDLVKTWLPAIVSILCSGVVALGIYSLDSRIALAIQKELKGYVSSQRCSDMHAAQTQSQEEYRAKVCVELQGIREQMTSMEKQIMALAVVAVGDKKDLIAVLQGNSQLPS